MTVKSAVCLFLSRENKHNFVCVFIIYPQSRYNQFFPNSAVIHEFRVRDVCCLVPMPLGTLTVPGIKWQLLNRIPIKIL